MDNNVDLIIGLPSYNESDSISFVTKQVDLGIQKYLPGLKCLIINSDSGSTDDTKGAFLGTSTATPKEFYTTAEIKSGKGTALRKIFQRVIETGARYSIVVDTDLKSITPEWIRNMALSLFQGYDMVVPKYLRHRFDGTITNMVVYPLIYGIFGKDIRQPIGGDFAFSRKAAKTFLLAKWVRSTYQYGIDIFMTTQAITNDLRICQVDLGLKIHKPSAPKLNLMFEQVVQTLLDTIKNAKDTFAQIKAVEKIPVIPMKTSGEVGPLEVNKDKILDKCQELFTEHKMLYEHILPLDFFRKVSEDLPTRSISLSPKEWHSFMYGMVAKYVKDDSANLIPAFKLGYFLRVASFVDEVQHMKDTQAENLVIEQARLFLENRDSYFQQITPSIKVAPQVVQ